MAQVATPEQPPMAPRTREARGSPTLIKHGAVKTATSQVVEETGGQPSEPRSTAIPVKREGTGSGTQKPDPGAPTTPTDRAKVKGSRIPNPRPSSNWTAPPLFKLKTNLTQGTSEASSDATARNQTKQAQVTPADEEPRTHRDNLRVKTQSSDTSQEQSPSQGWESVDDANLTTDDEAPGNNAIQKGVETGMETGIWAMYGIKRPKRREILSQTAISSTHDITMRLKRELNSDECTCRYWSL